MKRLWEATDISTNVFVIEVEVWSEFNDLSQLILLYARIK